MRKLALGVVVALVVLFVARALYVRHQVLSGDMYARDRWPWERTYGRDLLRSGSTGALRATGVYTIEFFTSPDPLSAADVAALEHALHDPAPVVRACALDSLLHEGVWDSTRAVEALAAALRDDAPIPAADLEEVSSRTSLDANVGWALERWRKVHGEAPVTPAALATAWVHDFNYPMIALDGDLFEDDERRRAVEATIPPKFTYTPGSFEQDRAAALARLREWSARAAPGVLIRDAAGEPAWVASAQAAAASSRSE